MFISLAYWKTTQHASSREHNMLDGSSQLQLVGRSFLKPCSSTLSSLMLSLSAPISDLILVNQSLQSSHALGQLSCCRLVPSVPFPLQDMCRFLPYVCSELCKDAPLQSREAELPCLTTFTACSTSLPITPTGAVSCQ